MLGGTCGWRGRGGGGDCQLAAERRLSVGQLAEKAAGQAGQGAPPPAPEPEARRAANEIPLEDDGLDHAIGDQRQKLLHIQRCACVASRRVSEREPQSRGVWMYYGRP